VPEPITVQNLVLDPKTDPKTGFGPKSDPKVTQKPVFTEERGSKTGF